MARKIKGEYTYKQKRHFDAMAKSFEAIERQQRLEAEQYPEEDRELEEEVLYYTTLKKYDTFEE